MNEKNTSDEAKGKNPGDGNKPVKKIPVSVIKGETKEVVVKGKIKLEDPVRVVGETDGPPVYVRVKDEPPLKMEVSNEIPLTVDVGKTPVNVNLTTNERPAGEITAEDFFMTIKNLPFYFGRTFTNRKYTWTDYDVLKAHVCEDIDNILPIDEEGFNKQFEFKAYRSLSGSGDVFNYLRGITMQHRWRIADIIYPPGLELIYNYWMDEGSVSQTLFAITERYRNRPGNGRRTCEASHLIRSGG